MIRSLLARCTIGLRRDRRTIAATTAVALLLPAAPLSVATAPKASAAAAVIDAIIPDGTVIGDQCHDGRVVGPDRITDFGKDKRLYVSSTGPTRLEKNSETTWKFGSNDPRVEFQNSDGNALGTHSPKPGVDFSQDYIEFGSPGNVPLAAGDVVMVFHDGYGGKTDLGLLESADFVYNGGDSFWACTSGDSPPAQPTVLNATVGKHEGAVTLSPDAGQGISSYQLTFKKLETNISFVVPDVNNEASTVSFIQSNDETVVSFRDSRLPDQIVVDGVLTDNFDNRPWTVEVKAVSAAGQRVSEPSEPFEFVPAIEKPTRKTSHVVDVVHYKETNGQVASKINIQGGGNQAGGVCKDGDMASDGYWCVVGAGYDPDGARSWNNTFRVKLDGTAPEDASVLIGIAEADVEEVKPSDKSCPPGNGNSKASQRTLCLALDDTFEKAQGEQYLYLQDGSTKELLPFAVWDFGGDPDKDEIWGQEPKEPYEWADYHILIVEEGVSGGTFDEDSTDFTDFCDDSNWEKLPTTSKPIDCQQHGIELRAIFDWDNSVLRTLSWLDKVQQFGSRSADNKPEDYVNPTSLDSGRIPNQIANGDLAFFQMSGSGGDAISNLDISNLTNMYRMFLQAENFNEDLSLWETPIVTDMSRMFDGAYKFDQDLSSWETSKVEDMSYMFASAEEFDGDLSSWDTSNVTNMSYMFSRAKVFSGNLSSWKTSKVKDMSYMFDRAYMFRTGTSGWDTSNVEDMSYMFKEAYDDQKSGFNEDISRWDTSKVTNMQGMFEDAIHFNQDISGWDTSNVEDMSYMFRLADLDDESGSPFKRHFNQDLSGWNVLNVERFDYFDDVPDTDRDLWTGDFCNSGRPIWGTRGGCLVLSVSPDPVRAEESELDKENFDVRNLFSLAVEPPGSESDARALESSYPLFYSVGNGGNFEVTMAPDSEEQLKLERDAQGTGFMKVPVSGMFDPSLNVEVTAESGVEGEDASTSFAVFAPCKADEDVVVSVEQVGAVLVDSVEVQVTLEAGFGVVPPGTVTLVGSGGFESTSIEVSGGESTWTSDRETVGIKLPATAATMTSAELVERVFGTMQGTFTWGERQGDGGPDCDQGGTSTSQWVDFELDVSKDLICSVYPALKELQQELATPGTADVTVSARSGGVQVRAGDVDGDGVANEDDPDVDGDGTPNESDSDMDGDGTPNVTDPDMDGDGIANAGDDFPKGPPPVARPMPIGLTEAERDALLEQLYGEQVPVTYPVPGSDFEDGGDYAEGAGQIVVGPDPEIVVDLAMDRVREAGQGLDCNGDGTTDIELPEFGWPVIPDGETDSGSDSGNGGDAGGGSGSGSGGSSGDSGSGAAGGLRVALAAPAEAFKGVPAELEATVTPSTTDGVVEFAVRNIDLTGEETVRLLGSAPVEDGKASIKLVPEDYGDAIVYARVTEKGSGAQDTTARAAVVNPAPFADNFSLTVGGDAWLPVETGNVLGYGYSPVEFTTMTGEAPRITTPVDGSCQVLSTRSIPPQIRMLGTAIAPKRCSFTVTTPGGGAYAPISYTYDVALSMGTQTATLAADKAKKTIKKGSMVTVAKKTQTKTDEDYKLKGKKINWSVTSGKDVCSVKTSSSGKVSVKGKKKGTCTVKAKASKVKRKYKSLTEFYNFRVK